MECPNTAPRSAWSLLRWIIMKWVRYIALVLLAILLFVLGVQLVRWGQARATDPDASFIEPTLLVTNIQITDHNPNETHLVLDLQLVNPAPIGLALDSLQYSLGIEGVEVIHSTYAKRIQVKANDTASISFPVVVDSKKLVNRLKQLEAQGLDSVHYNTDVGFQLSALGAKPLELHTSSYAPLVKLPKVAFQDPHIDKLGLKNSAFTIDMAFFNPNVFAFDIKKTRMKLRTGDGQVFETQIDSAIHVPKQDTVLIHLPVDLALGKLIKAAFGALVKPEKTHFSYDLSFIIISKEHALNNSAVVITGEGVVADLEK